MPIYEYRCRGCGHRFEMLQRMGEGPDGLACPRCGEGGVDKQFSTFAAGSGNGGGDAEAAAGAGCACGAPPGFSCGN